MELTVFTVLRDFSITFVVAVCWGILFGSPRRVLWVAGLLGGLAHALRFVLIEFEVGIITATLVGSVLVGLLGIFAAHRVHSPPVVFTMPACITMIPGLFAYRTMLGGIKLTNLSAVGRNPDILFDLSYNLTLTMSLLFTLAIGISIGALLFRKSSVRDIHIKEMIIRNKVKNNDAGAQ